MKTSSNKSRIIFTAVMIITLFLSEMMIIPINSPVSAKEPLTIVINQGHSQGYEWGADQRNGILEADVNARLASKLGNLLLKYGYDVYLTHPAPGFSGKTLMTGAEAVSLNSIAENINALNPDLSISIHCNGGSFTSSGYRFLWSSYKANLDMQDVYPVYGFWYNGDAAWFDRTPCPAALQSLELAECLKDTFITGLGDKLPAHPNDIRERDDCVIAQTNCPSVLIEAVFLSNPYDVAFIAYNKNQNKMVSCIKTAIDRFFSGQTSKHKDQNISGWKYINGNWYYLDPAKNNTGWQYIDGFWYYLNPVSHPTKYYYIEKSGTAVSPWVNKGRYYVNPEEFWESRISFKEESYSENTTIMGNQIIIKEKMLEYFKNNADFDDDFYGISLDYFIEQYIDEAYVEGIRPEIAFAQMIYETNFLRYGGNVQRDQLNFANLGAADNGANSASFPNIKTGIRAQIQHLKAYASSEALKTICVDPRFNRVPRSSATTIGNLGNGNWSTDPHYAQELLKHLKNMQ